MWKMCCHFFVCWMTHCTFVHSILNHVTRNVEDIVRFPLPIPPFWNDFFSIVYIYLHLRKTRVSTGGFTMEQFFSHQNDALCLTNVLKDIIIKRAKEIFLNSTISSKLYYVHFLRQCKLFYGLVFFINDEI